MLISKMSQMLIVTRSDSSEIMMIGKANVKLFGINRARLYRPLSLIPKQSFKNVYLRKRTNLQDTASNP